MNQLKNKVAWVTGAGSGIGQAAAIALAAVGASVVLGGRREARLREAAARIAANGGKALVKPGDLTDATVANQVAAEIGNRLGRLDILVNNAGVNILRRRWVELDPSDADYVLDGNLS